MNAHPPFWFSLASFCAYGVIGLLQILWWIDFQRWRRRMQQQIREHTAKIREAARLEITRRVGGTRPPPP